MHFNHSPTCSRTGDDWSAVRGFVDKLARTFVSRPLSDGLALRHCLTSMMGVCAKYSDLEEYAKQCVAMDRRPLPFPAWEVQFSIRSSFRLSPVFVWGVLFPNDVLLPCASLLSRSSSLLCADAGVFSSRSSHFIGVHGDDLQALLKAKHLSQPAPRVQTNRVTRLESMEVISTTY